MSLSYQDRNSAEIGRLREVVNARLMLYRCKNDSDLDDKQTSLMRGRIRECKDLLALMEPANSPAPDDAVGLAGFGPNTENHE